MVDGSCVFNNFSMARNDSDMLTSGNCVELMRTISVHVREFRSGRYAVWHGSLRPKAPSSTHDTRLGCLGFELAPSAPDGFPLRSTHSTTNTLSVILPAISFTDHYSGWNTPLGPSRCLQNVPKMPRRSQRLRADSTSSACRSLRPPSRHSFRFFLSTSS
jgi:hypothetical protein